MLQYMIHIFRFGSMPLHHTILWDFLLRLKSGVPGDTPITWIGSKKHAEELDSFPDDIELVLFRDAESKFAAGSNWISK